MIKIRMITIDSSLSEWMGNKISRIISARNLQILCELCFAKGHELLQLYCIRTLLAVVPFLHVKNRLKQRRLFELPSTYLKAK
jgi:hypothetical protein